MKARSPHSAAGSETGTHSELLAKARALRSQLQELAEEAERQQAGQLIETDIWMSFNELARAIDELEKRA